MSQSKHSRVTINMSAQIAEYIAQLERTGLYGVGVEAVVCELVLEGLRKAAERKFITLTTR